jgi:hypothetical protein
MHNLPWYAFQGKGRNKTADITIKSMYYKCNGRVFVFGSKTIETTHEIASLVPKTSKQA